MDKVYIVIQNDFDGVWYDKKVFGVYKEEQDAKDAIKNNPKLDLDYESHYLT